MGRIYPQAVISSTDQLHVYAQMNHKQLEESSEYSKVSKITKKLWLEISQMQNLQPFSNGPSKALQGCFCWFSRARGATVLAGSHSKIRVFTFSQQFWQKNPLK